MKLEEVWLQIVAGVIVGLVLMYQQRKLKNIDTINHRITEIEKREHSFVSWPEHDKAMERLEDRHTAATERVIDKLEHIHGEMSANITNLYTLLIDRDK